MDDTVRIARGFYIRRRPESGIWFVHKRYRGRQLRWSTRTRDKEQALQNTSLYEPDLLCNKPSRAVHRDYYIRAVKQAKKNAKAKGLQCDLTDAWLNETIEKQKDRCAVTRLPFLYLEDLRDRRQPFYPSVDRIDSASGYVRDNCRLVCVATNYAMHEWGEWVFEELAHAFLLNRVR